MSKKTDITGLRTKSKTAGWFTVSSYINNQKVLVQFEDTGTLVWTSKDRAVKGTVRDKNHPSIFGVGCIGVGEYQSRYGSKGAKTKEYQVWENMIARCYYPKSSRYEAYGGQGVVVCEEWLNFQNFAKWFATNYKEGYHLDKDILGDGKHYGLEVCRFIPQKLNNLLVNNTVNVGKESGLPIGVSVSRDRYQCTLSLNLTNGVKYGADTVQKVREYYEKAKTNGVREVVESFREDIPVEVYLKLKDYKFEYSEGEVDE